MLLFSEKVLKIKISINLFDQSVKISNSLFSIVLLISLAA